MTNASKVQAFRWEAELCDPVREYLRDLGYTKQDVEVSFYDYRMDICAYNPELDQLIGIELKLHNWRRAIKQAAIYQLCVHRAFVAMPDSAVHNVDRGQLSQVGVGLISVSQQECTMCVEAGNPGVLCDEYRDKYIRLMKELAE